MNKTVLRRYTIEGVEPALLKSPKLLGKGNLNLSALINKLAPKLKVRNQRPTKHGLGNRSPAV